MTRSVFSLSEEETLELGAQLAKNLRAGDLVLLEGDLGLGKTVFARGVANGLGIPADEVSSPSYTLIQEYRGGPFPIFHVDLYRIEDPEDLTTIGLEDVLDGSALTIVEWGDKLPPYFRRECTIVRFYDRGEGSRQIEIERQTSNPIHRSGDA